MKRRLFKLVLFLLLGAVVNVAVAWGCALWSNPYAKEFTFSFAGDDDGFPPWVVNKANSFGAIVTLTGGSAGTHVREIPEMPRLFDVLPRWIDETDHKRFRWNAFDSRGWPTQSLWSALEAYESVNPAEYQVHGGWRVGVSPIVFGWRRVPRTLPLRPIWPGFAINTVFYAAILWMLFAPFQLRR